MASKSSKDSPSAKKARACESSFEESQSLWDEVASTVQKQSSSRISPIEIPQPKAKKSPVSEKLSQPLPPAIGQKNPPKSADQSIGYVVGPANLAMPVHAGIDRSTVRKLQQGKMPLEARLDLHGLSQLQARQRLQQFIFNAIQKDLRTILVITGKGKAGRGVLRENVPQWLSELPLSEQIIAFGPSRPQDGGAGALYVRLKRKRG